MIFRFTKKAQEKLKTGKLSSVPEGDLFREWYVHVFIVERCRYYLVTHAASLFSVVVRGAGISSEEKLFDYVFQELKEKFSEAGCDNMFERIAVAGSEEIVLSNTANRKIIGSMNDIIQCLQVIRDDTAVSAHEMSAFINRTPFTYINGNSPFKFIKDADNSLK